MINFCNKLKNINKATTKQQKQEWWDVEGILHNQKYKFDLRPLKNNSKEGSFKTKADKIVYDLKNQYIVVDVKELHLYLKTQNSKVILLEKLIPALEWNIVINKSEKK
jgi:hypothetical protein|tara:strand:- start:96 stop:419 length:324 start_codon:yes stop_codon:yes gene_type:complete